VFHRKVTRGTLVDRRACFTAVRHVKPPPDLASGDIPISRPEIEGSVCSFSQPRVNSGPIGSSTRGLYYGSLTEATPSPTIPVDAPIPVSSPLDRSSR